MVEKAKAAKKPAVKKTSAAKASAAKKTAVKKSPAKTAQKVINKLDKKYASANVAQEEKAISGIFPK